MNPTQSAFNQASHYEKMMLSLFFPERQRIKKKCGAWSSNSGFKIFKKASQQEIESFTCSILEILGEQTEFYQKCYKDDYISNIGIGYQNSYIQPNYLYFAYNISRKNSNQKQQISKSKYSKNNYLLNKSQNKKQKLLNTSKCPTEFVGEKAKLVADPSEPANFTSLKSNKAEIITPATIAAKTTGTTGFTLPAAMTGTASTTATTRTTGFALPAGTTGTTF